MSKPTIPYVPSMYANSPSSKGDRPPVVLWYGTDRTTQDKYAELYETYLGRNTAEVAKAELDALSEKIGELRTAYEGSCAMQEALGKENPESAAAFSRAEAMLTKQLDAKRAELEKYQPWESDDARDIVRIELLSLVVVAYEIDGDRKPWPHTIEARRELLTSSGIAPSAWEECLYAFRSTQFYRGALGKS